MDVVRELLLAWRVALGAPETRHGLIARSTRSVPILCLPFQDLPLRCRASQGGKGMIMGHTILLLENDENDVFVFRRALATLGYTGRLHVVSSLVQARAYMLGVNEFINRAAYPIPDLIVADFGLRGETGSDFVQWLLQQPEFLDIPVTFFSGSLPEAGMRDLLARFGYPVFKKNVDFHTNTQTVGQILKLVEA